MSGAITVPCLIDQVSQPLCSDLWSYEFALDRSWHSFLPCHVPSRGVISMRLGQRGIATAIAERAAHKFAPKRIELCYHTAFQLGQLRRELREDRRR